MQSHNSAQRFQLLALTGLAVMIAGCSAEVQPVSFEPNLVHTMKYVVRTNDAPIDQAAMDQASVDATWVVETMFGTPDQPKLPEVVTKDQKLASIVSMDRLARVSGPGTEQGRGLYRELCVVCHGVTGNGRGSTAAVQVPYPRDFRLGVFKWKSTPRGVKPTRDDLARVISHGIDGTAMKGLADLARDISAQVTEDDIQALVDYVIYLSWRGELERLQIDMAVMDGIIEDGERIINSEFGEKSLADPEAAKGEIELAERFEEDWGYAQDYVVEIGESWLEADDEVLAAPDPPTGFPLAESYADAVAFRQGEKADEFNASVKRGQELFVGKIAACNKCHGEKGLGDGQTTDYDDWTKDWTTRVGLKPEDRDSLVPLLARGALPPINAVPRNFAGGVYRGGADSKDLYVRITQGIDGTPMPAATFVEGQFEQDDVWHLINFIRSLQTEEMPPAEQATASL